MLLITNDNFLKVEQSLDSDLSELTNNLDNKMFNICLKLIALTNERIFFLEARLLNLPLEKLTSKSHIQINPFVLLPFLLNFCEPE